MIAFEECVATVELINGELVVTDYSYSLGDSDLQEVYEYILMLYKGAFA